MKKRFTFLTAAMLLSMMIFLPWNVAGETTTYSLTPNQASTCSTATNYITTLTEFTYNQISWKMNQWNPKNLQVKTNQSSATSEFRYYNTSAFPGRITQVVMTFSALTVSDASKLMFLGGTSEVSATTGGTAGTWNNTDKTLTWTPGNSDNFTYFAFYQNGRAASGTNNLAKSNAIVVTYETGGGGGVGSTYTVTYNANCGETPATWLDDNGGEGYSGAYTVKGNDNVNINFSNVGHDFGNWNTAANSTGTAYSGGNEINSLNSNLTLYAIWNPHTHNVTVNEVSHGTVTGYTNPVAYGTIVTLTYTPNDGQYYSATFSSDNVTITNGTFIMPDNDVSITVTETELPKYTVTFSDSGGTLTEDHYGAGVTLPNRTGDVTYSFAGWTTSNIATETTTAPAQILTGTYHPTENITLYPVYTRSEGEGVKWKKIANFASVDEGTYALITTTGLAFTGTINNSGHGTVTSSSFTFDSNDESYSAPEGTCELTLTAVTDENDVILGYTMYNSDHNYLYASKAGSGGLSWHETEDDYWHITNKFSFNLWSYSKDYSDNYAFLRTYSSSGTYTFRTYSSGGNTLNGATFYFVKKVSLSTTYYISTLSSIAVPSFDPTSKNFSTENLSVTISVADGCFIKYTLDNTDPLESGTTSLSNSVTLTLTGTTTIRALTKNGDNYSAEASETYTRVYSVALISNGVEKSIEEVVPTESISLSAPDNVPQGFTFMGWTADPSTPNTLVNTEYTPTGNVTLYASFAKIISSSYDIVTSASDMTEGEYIIATYYGSKYYTIKSNNAVSSNPVAYEQAVTDNAITGDVTELTWSFTGTSSAMVIKSTSYNLYLNTTNAAQGVKINTTDDDSWTISYNSTDNYFSMKSKNGGGSRYLSVLISNDSPQDWRNYISGTQNSYQQITLFKKNAIVSENYYTSIQELPAGNSEIATVTPADLITVPSGAVLTITGACTGTAENLIIEDGGQLIVPNNATVAATFIKNVPETAGDKDGAVEVTGWTLISSPTYNVPNDGNPYENFSAVNNLEDAGGYLLYNYDEENRIWRSSQTTGHTYSTLNVGQGYLYGNSTGTAIEFTGNVNSAASYSVALSYNTKATDNLAGFNLIGNPYSENISNTDITFVKQDADDITPAGGYVLKNDGTWNTTAATSFEPNSGFLVQINDAGYTAVISKPEHGGKATLANNDYISFTVANSQYEDVTYAWFGKSIPLNKINHRNDEIPMLYIPQNGENYAIAMMDDNTNSFNLNFEAKTTGNYTLSFKTNGEFNYLHVIDRLTGEDIDMLVEGEYSFVGSPRDNANRFIVRLGYLPNYSDNGEDIFAYQNGNDIVVSGEGELQIFDVMGRMVSSQRINGVETMCTSSLQNGVYVFRLNEKTQKIVVR